MSLAVGVAVRVPLQGLLAVGPRDLLPRGGLGHPQYFVRVHVCGWRQRAWEAGAGGGSPQARRRTEGQDWHALIHSPAKEGKGLGTRPPE